MQSLVTLIYGSENDAASLRAAAGLAQVIGGRLTVVHAIDVDMVAVAAFQTAAAAYDAAHASLGRASVRAAFKDIRAALPDARLIEAGPCRAQLPRAPALLHAPDLPRRHEPPDLQGLDGFLHVQEMHFKGLALPRQANEIAHRALRIGGAVHRHERSDHGKDSFFRDAIGLR